MSRVLSNNATLKYAVESTTIGTLPTTDLWRSLEPNSISAYGAAITTVSRRPISQDRGRKKGTVTNLESSVEFEGDLTMDSFTDFAEGFVFAEMANTEFSLKDGTGTIPPPAVATTDDFTVDSVSAALAAKMVYAVGQGITLVYALGYSNAANNGIHALNVDVGSTDTTIQVASTLVAETPPTNATLDVCGIRVSDGDITLGTPSGGIATLTSAADIANWATLGIQAGMFILIGSPTGTAGVAQNALSDSTADDTYGYARVRTVASNVLTLDKLATTLDSGANNTGDGVCDILFGRFLRNVAVTADADDTRYAERSYTFEATYPDLGGVGTDEYEYAVGNFANELSLNLPLTDKATATWGFIGTNTQDITATRSATSAPAGPGAGVDTLRTTALNTTSSFAALTTDVISAVSDVCFKSLTLTINNNVSPENCLGTLGASFVNAGLFEVNMEGQMLFTDKAIVNAVKNNTTVTFLAILSNDNGAFAFDIPALTFGGGDREYPVDQSVLVNVTGEAFNDPTGAIPNVSLGMSFFPVGLDSTTV